MNYAPGAIFIAMVFCPTPCSADESAASLAETAYAGCLSHLQSFENIDCEFVLTKGVVKSATDFATAMKGEIVGRITTKARWVKRGKVERLEILIDDQSKQRLEQGPIPHPTKKGLGTVSVDFAGTNSLNNGELFLNHMSDVGQAVLYPADFPHQPREEMHPFFLLFFGPTTFGWCSEQHRKGLLTLKDAQFAQHDDRGVISVIYASQQNQTNTFELDPRRGFLPITSLFSEPGNSDMLAILETVKCTHGRFFPSKIRWVTRQEAPRLRFTIKALDLTRLEVDRTPTDDDLSVQLPSGTVVFPVMKPAGGFTTRQVEKIGPYDIQKLWKMSERAEGEPLMDTGVPRPSSWRWIAAGACFVFFVGYLVFRRRQIGVTSRMDDT